MLICDKCIVCLHSYAPVFLVSKATDAHDFSFATEGRSACWGPNKSAMTRLRMGARFLRRNLIGAIYLALSLVASLVIFRILYGMFVPADRTADEPEQRRTNRRAVPIAKLVDNYRHGVMKSFSESPFTTKLECVGTTASERVCLAKHMCYSPMTNKFFAIPSRDESGLKTRWMREDDSRLLDTTTINDHNVFYFEFEEDPAFGQRELQRTGMQYISVSKRTFLFGRFVYNNVMHNLHDDFIGQYLLHRNYSVRDGVIDPDNYVFFTDGLVEAPFDHLFATLSRHPFMYRAHLHDKHRDMAPICFEDVVIGNSKEGTWYDYGFFREPQGPIAKTGPNGAVVREAAEYLLKFYNVPRWNEKEVARLMGRLARGPLHPADRANRRYYVSVFSRTRDRLILNERELLKRLGTQYGLPVQLVQLERLDFGEIVEIMSRTVVAVGLHGSALIFAMFMPRRAVLVEMFPYAVPGENYSPYRTLALLPGVDLAYRLWINRDATTNYAQIGARHSFDNLKAETLLNILSLKTVPPHVCCGNMAWNVRIYQDTMANVTQLLSLIGDGIRESQEATRRPAKHTLQSTELLEMSRHRVQSITFDVHAQDAFIGNDAVLMRLLIVKWANPWESLTGRVKPSQYGVWVDEFVDEVIVPDGSLFVHTCVEGSEMNLWIRAYRRDKQTGESLPAGPFSQKFTVKCQL